MTLLTTVRRRAPVFIALASCVLGLAGCGKPAADAAKGAPGGAGPGVGGAPPALPVTAIRVAATKVPVSLETVGTAEGSREVEIRARVSGILEKRLYNEGEAVKAGTVLFVIDPAPYDLAVQQARAALQQERVRRELAETEARRLEPLAKERAVPQREVDQALATARQAGAAIAAAEARVKEAELNLSYTQVKAPIAGITGRAQRSEGSLVTANTESSLLTTLSQANPIWVRFSLAEDEYRRVRGNERGARVHLVGDDGKVAAEGKLNFAGTTVDPKLGAVQLRGEFANPNQRWLPGQFVKVRVLAGEQEGMRVPQAAVMQTEQGRLVMTVGADNKVVPKPVQTAGWVGQDVIVTGGLADGDRVIVDNLVKLRPGAPVQPRAPGEAPPAPPAGGASAAPQKAGK